MNRLSTSSSGGGFGPPNPTSRLTRFESRRDRVELSQIADEVSAAAAAAITNKPQRPPGSVAFKGSSHATGIRAEATPPGQPSADFGALSQVRYRLGDLDDIRFELSPDRATQQFQQQKHAVLVTLLD